MKKTRHSWNSTLPPSKGPTRKTRLKTKGRSRFPKRRIAGYPAFIRSYPCLVLGVAPHECDYAECAHLDSVGSGGYDIDNCVPLCPNLHRRARGSLHNLGEATFCKLWGVDLREAAHRLGRRWREQQGETAA